MAAVVQRRLAASRHRPTVDRSEHDHRQPRSAALPCRVGPSSTPTLPQPRGTRTLANRRHKALQAWRIPSRINALASTWRARAGWLRGQSQAMQQSPHAAPGSYGTDRRPPRRGGRRMMRLYHVPGSRSTRVLWMLEEIGAPYELTVMTREDRKTAEHIS